MLLPTCISTSLLKSLRLYSCSDLSSKTTLSSDEVVALFTATEAGGVVPFQRSVAGSFFSELCFQLPATTAEANDGSGDAAAAFACPFLVSLAGGS